MMRESFVVSLGILELSVLLILLALVVDVVPYGWTMYSAVVMRDLLWIVGIEDGELTTVDTARMHR